MYSVMTVSGIVFALLYLKYREKKVGSIARYGESLFVFGMIGAAVGAKLLYILLSIPDILSELNEGGVSAESLAAEYVYGGFVFYGGLYGALLALWLCCRKYRLAYDEAAAFLFPCFPLVHMFGRIGCFFMGCCYGNPAGDGRLGVVFSASGFAPSGTALIPVQLYEAGEELLLFVFLAVAAEKEKNGYAMLGGYLVCYGVARFLLEFLRGDVYRGFIGVFSVSQVISIATVFIGAVFLLRKRTVKIS